jgi:hypothetical protein
MVSPPEGAEAMTDDRRWDTELQRWVYGIEVSDALNDAQTAIEEYYNGDREWAERWLVRAYQANQNPALSNPVGDDSLLAANEFRDRRIPTK